MNIMNLYVYENRSMSNDLSKPLMLENLNVDNVQIHIPKEIDGTDMGTWAWWFVYQNAKREKYSIPMTLEGVTNDEGEEEYISTVGLNHGFTGKHGTVMYAIEAVQADGSGTVTHEWHTKTYKLEIVYTLQGNQTEYDESESDIISALISRVNELIQSGAEIAEIAETIEHAAETAQEVIDSIPADYSTLSAQVDTNTEDIGGLKADLFKTAIPNSYNTGYIGSDGTAVTKDTNYKYCDYIKMQYASSTIVSFKVSFLSSRGMAFYDADKNLISAINGNNCADYGYTEGSMPQVVNVPVPEKAVYARISQRSTYVNGVEDFAMTGVNYGNVPENVAKIPNIETKLNAVENSDEENTDSRKLSVSFTNGGFITAGGIVSSNAGLAYTDYICIGGLVNLRLPMYISGTGASIVLFNSKKEVTRYFKNPSSPVGTELEINLADNEMYIRLSCYISYLSGFYLITDKIADSIAKTFRTLNGQDDVLFSKIIRDGGMTRIFNTIGVIGDSLSSGEMAYGNASGESTTEYTDMYQYSWIQYLARECGIKAFNFSQGGMNTENFLSGTGGQLAKFQNPDNKCQAYFIALGHNDYNYGVPIGSTSDINISDPTQDPDTYYGNYAHIIALIKQIQPNAKIFCICMKSSHFANYNVAIRYMATVFDNVYVLDFETYYPLLESSWEYTQGHGNAMGYLNYSWQIGTYVDWIIRNNRTDFKYVQFIGTDYDQYIPTN